MKLTDFDLPHNKTQTFLTTRYDNNLHNNTIQHVLIDHNASLVAVLPKSDLVIKFIKARSWHEYLKLLWNHSRLTKEVKGCSLLRSLGLRVPEIYEVGYGLIPSPRHKYLGYYIMENLTKSDYHELSRLIKDNMISSSIRKKIMQSVHDGLKTMRDHNIVFSDFHLDNVFANQSGDLAWIDTGVTTYKTFNKEKFRKKYNHSINRYINYQYNGTELLSLPEKAVFENLLFISEQN